AQRNSPLQTFRIKTAYNKLLKATHIRLRGVKIGASRNPPQRFKGTPAGKVIAYAVVWAKSFHKFLHCSRSLITHGVLRSDARAWRVPNRGPYSHVDEV